MIRQIVLLFVVLVMGLTGTAHDLTAQDDPGRISIYNVALSGDKKVMAVTYDTKVLIQYVDFFDTTSGNRIHTFENEDRTRVVVKFALSPTGERLLWTDGDMGLYVYDRRDGSVTTLQNPGMAARYSGVFWHPTDDLMAGYLFGNSVSFLDSNTGQDLGDLATSKGVSDLAFSPDGSQVAITGFNRGMDPSLMDSDAIEIWDEFPQGGVRLDDPLIAIPGVGGNAIDWSPDGTRIAAVDDGGFLIYNVAEQRMEAERIGAYLDDDFYDLSWSPNGRYIATGGWLRIWDTTDFSLVQEFNDVLSTSLIVWSPDGQTLFTDDAEITVDGLIGHAVDVSDDNAAPTPEAESD